MAARPPPDARRPRPSGWPPRSTPSEVVPKGRASSRSTVSPRRASNANPSRVGAAVRSAAARLEAGRSFTSNVDLIPESPAIVSCKPETLRPLVAPTSACQHEHRALSVGTPALPPPYHVPTRSLPVLSPPAPRRPQTLSSTDDRAAMTHSGLKRFIETGVDLGLLGLGLSRGSRICLALPNGPRGGGGCCCHLALTLASAWAPR